MLAVTDVDARDRTLPEAGRASHVDFAVPGAAFTGRLRGTSFAVPLVAGRLVRHYPAPPRARIAEARDLGGKGRDKLYALGLVCGGDGLTGGLASP